MSEMNDFQSYFLTEGDMVEEKKLSKLYQRNVLFGEKMLTNKELCLREIMF